MKNEINFAQLFMKNDEIHDEIHKCHNIFHKKDKKSHEFPKKCKKIDGFF